jgi:hypothetical protein
VSLDLAMRRPWKQRQFWLVTAPDGPNLAPYGGTRCDAFQKSDGTIPIHGCIADQAALHGLLQRVRYIGLPLISVTRIDPTSPIYPSHLP